MSQVFWLSFVDPARPKGTQFLGAALVEADTTTHAIRQSWSFGCNPGGEVQALALPSYDLMTDEQRQKLADTPFHTLMDKPELIRRGFVLEEEA